MRKGVGAVLLAIGAAAMCVGVWGEVAAALGETPSSDLNRSAGFYLSAIPLLFGLGLCFIGLATLRPRS